MLRQIPFSHDVAIGRPLPPNTLEQLQEIAQSGIEIGFTVERIPTSAGYSIRGMLFDELVCARDELAAAVGRPIHYFAFPFGCSKNLTAEAFRLARSAGYQGVLTAYGGYNMPGRDPFHLQRRSAEGSFERLQNWTTFDPIHDRRIRRLVADAARRGESDRAAA